MTPRRVILETLFLIACVAAILLLFVVLAGLADAAPHRVLETANQSPVGAAWAPRPSLALRTVPPPPPAVPRPAYSGGGGCASGPVHDLIVAQAWDDSYALYIADRESNCLPSAFNATPWPPGSSCHASGVFQILTGGPECDNWSRWSVSCGYAGASVFDYVANVEVSACMVANGGWGPWAL